MALEDFALAISRDGADALRVEVRGDLDHVTNPRLVALIADCIGECDNLVVDLTDVSFVDAGGIAALARVVDLCGGARVGVTVEGQPPLLTRLLEITGYDLPRALEDR